ncbi:MAG: recombinase RecA, partial [Alphaproteobacteria bacterium]
PGGVGKTSLLIAEALAMASGRPLLHEIVHGGPQRIWLWNLEEPEDELARRIQATALHHAMSAGDIGDRLFVNAGPDNALLTASATMPGYVHEEVFSDLEREIQKRGIDVLVIDPFVSSHALDENDNVQIDRVVKRWSRLAQAARCAVHIIHHTRKSDQTVASESARGAKALVDAARMVRVLNLATAEELATMNLQPHMRVFHARRDKQNLSAGHDERSWYVLQSVSLGNGPPADDVGVVAAIEGPESAPNQFSAETIGAIQQVLDGKDRGYDQRASDWAGIDMAPILKLNPEDKAQRLRIRHTLGLLVQQAFLVRADAPHPRAGRTRPVVRVGKPALPPQSSDSSVDECGSVDA